MSECSVLLRAESCLVEFGEERSAAVAAVEDGCPL